MTGFFDLFVYYIFPVELFLAAVVFMIPLPKRTRFHLRFMSGLVVFFLCIWAYGELSLKIFPGLPFTSSPAYVLFFLFVFFEAAVLVLSCCKISVSESVHCIAFAYATQHFSNCLCRIVLHIDDPTNSTGYSFAYILIYLAVYILSYYFFARQLTLEKRSGVEIRMSIHYTVATLTVTLFLSIVSSNYRLQSPALYKISMIYAMFCCISLLYGQLYLFRSLNLRTELDLKTRLWQERKSQYDLSKENISLINQKCHDLKHQVRALRSMKNEPERESKLAELERSVMIYDSIVETGNDTIDTVLTEKNLICEQEHIVLTCIADGKCLNFMDIIDLYTLFGNILDNAIESVRKLDDTEQRVISITIFSKAELAFIRCENYYQGHLDFVDGVPRTTKNLDGWHGYGISSIRQIAEKYGGILSIAAENNIFTLNITLPVQNG